MMTRSSHSCALVSGYTVQPVTVSLNRENACDWAKAGHPRMCAASQISVISLFSTLQYYDLDRGFSGSTNLSRSHTHTHTHTYQKKQKHVDSAMHTHRHVFEKTLVP